MKFCPTCEVKYDEEILRFCTKCGTPLISENQPSFTAMPSQSSINIDDDFGEETVIVRKKPNQPEQVLPSQEEPRQRIVVPTSSPEPVRSQPQSHFQQTPKKSNTALTVLFTLVGTLIVIGGGLAVWLFLTSGKPLDANLNANSNLNKVDNNINANFSNLNSNTNMDSANYNFNLNVATNGNSNLNTNLSVNVNANKTPKPTPKPTLKPTNSNVNSNLSTGNSNSAVNKPNNTITSTPLPTVQPTPKPTANPANNTPRNVSVGNLNGRAVSLPKPAFPSSAKQAGANGQVVVQVTVDQDGNVISAKAMNGHPLLRSPAEIAAKQARFSPKIAGDYAKATGVLVYNFQIQ